MKHTIEFISYNGKYPCLCMGTLKLKIDDKEIIFSNSSEYCHYDKNKETMIYNKNCYPIFWTSGGSIKSNGCWDMWATRGDWEIYLSDYDRKHYTPDLLDMLDVLIDVFNKNVPQGCCGGCI